MVGELDEEMPKEMAGVELESGFTEACLLCMGPTVCQARSKLFILISSIITLFC